MQDADFVMRTDPGLFCERSDLYVWVAGFLLKTLENNCRDRAHRNLQISDGRDGRAALRRIASLGLTCSCQPNTCTYHEQARKKQARLPKAPPAPFTSPTVASRREKTKLV